MAMAAPFIMAGAAVASSAMQAAGSAAQGNAAYSAAAQNARIMGENAARLEDAAKLEEAQGVTALARGRRQGRKLRGDSLAALASAGVDVYDGSPLEVLVEQGRESEFQAQQAKWERDYRAWQMRTQAYDTSQRAMLTLQGGEQARSAGYSAAAGAIVGGIGKAAGSFAGGGGFGSMFSIAGGAAGGAGGAGSG